MPFVHSQSAVSRPGSGYRAAVTVPVTLSKSESPFRSTSDQGTADTVGDGPRGTVSSCT